MWIFVYYLLHMKRTLETIMMEERLSGSMGGGQAKLLLIYLVYSSPFLSLPLLFCFDQFPAF